MKTVVIVGRPNVGKSTLFNALLGRRRAITHAEAGVTRDLIKHEFTNASENFCLVDLGGLFGEGLYSPELTERGLAEMKEADLVLFTVSVEGICAEDLHILEKARRCPGELVLLINKVDTEPRELGIHEFHELGIKKSIHVSAAHNRNIDRLWQLIYRSLGIKEKEKDTEQLPKDEEDRVLRLLIAGRPNSGKSSFFNYVLKRSQNLVSQIPGTTRDSTAEVLRYRDKNYIIIDSAGLRRKARVSDDLEYYSTQRAIGSIASSDIVLLFVDVDRGFAVQDKKIASLAISKQKSIIVCLNKEDLLTGDQEEKKQIIEKIYFHMPQLKYAPVCLLSSLTGKGIPKIFDNITKLHRQLKTSLKTSYVNILFQRFMQENPPPMIKRRRAKIRFAAQASSQPMCFELHVNAKELFSESYVQYLRNSVQKQCELYNIPIFLELTEKESQRT